MQVLGKMGIVLKVKLILIIVVLSWICSLIWNLRTPHKGLILSDIIQSEADLNQYRLGRLHYTDIKDGLSQFDCWKEIVSPLLERVACPGLLLAVMFTQKNTTDETIEALEELQVELSYMITNCYCQSQGLSKLICPPAEDFEHVPSYSSVLENCAKQKCFNKLDEDAFSIIKSSIVKICYYTQAKKLMDPELFPNKDDELKQLEHLQNMVSKFTKFPNVHMKYLDQLVQDAILLSHQQIPVWKKFMDKLTEEWAVFMDEVELWLGIGKYREIQPLMD